MKREWPTVRRKPNGSYDVDCGKRLTGKRVIYNRSTKADAVALAEQLRQQRNALGMAALKLTPAQLMDAAGAFDVLLRAGIKATLTRLAQREVVPVIDLDAPRPTLLSVAIDERLTSMRGSNCRRRSIESARQRLMYYLDKHPGRYCDGVTPKAIEEFLDANCAMPVTRKSMLAELRAFFTFCLARGYVTSNPATAVPMPKIERKTAEFMLAADVERFMHEIERTTGPGLTAHAALGFFAGIRTAELDKMGSCWMLCESGTIAIGSNIAKARSQRNVRISENLMLWLHRCREWVGVPTSKTFTPVRIAICKRLGIAWPSNCMRHSFASHHLAKHQNAEATALELGHTSGTKVLFDHYRGLATKEDAERFWSIVPKGGA